MRRAALALLLALAACGYHLGGTDTTAPPEARTIAILLFQNRARENGLEVHVRRAIEDEFRRRSRLQVVPEHEADLVLSGRIARFTSVPVAFSATDEAVQFQTSIQVSFRLVERVTGRLLQETKALVETQDFGAESGVVISSSPRFQRGTINPRDLSDLPNVQIGEARRHAATNDLLDLLGRDVYAQAMEGF